MGNRLEHKTSTHSAITFKDGDSADSPGSIRFYFAAFGNWDDEYPIPDRVEKGATLPYLQALIKSGFSSFNHASIKGNALPIGTISDAGEDDYGAWADVEFHSTPAAQAVYTVAKERYSRGKDVKASMAYTTRDFKMITDDSELKAKGINRGRSIMSLEPVEVGLVNIPANQSAILTGVKSLTLALEIDGKPVEFKALFEDALQDQTLSWWNLSSVLCGVLCQIDDMNATAHNLGVAFDYEGAIRGACSEFTDRLVEGKLAEIAEDEMVPEDMGDEDSADGSGGMASMGLGAEQMSLSGAAAPIKAKAGSKRLIDGRGFRADLAAMNDVVASIATRTEKRAALLLKEGRTFSGDNVAALSGHADAIDTHGKAMQDTAKSMRDMIEKATAAKATAADKAVGLVFEEGSAAKMLAGVSQLLLKLHQIDTAVGPEVTTA